MTAMFAGILNRAFSTVTISGDDVDHGPGGQYGHQCDPYPITCWTRCAAWTVSYAVPLFIGGALVKLDSGTYQSVNVVGLDDTSLFGRPELEQGIFRILC